MSVWISVASVNPVVTGNAFANDVFTGLAPDTVVLLYERGYMEVARRSARIVEELSKIWLGRSVAVKAQELPESVAELLSLSIDVGPNAVVNATPGRKIHALALYNLCVKLGCELRYHMVLDEKRFGYKPFPEAPLQAVKPLRITPSPSELEWSPPRLGSGPQQLKLSVHELAVVLLLLSIYEGAERIVVEAGRPPGAVVEAGLRGPHALVRVPGDHLEEACAALKASGALTPTNIDELAGAVESEDWILVLDTNAYVNGLHRLLPASARKRALPLTTVFNELWLPVERDKTLTSPETRKRVIGLASFYELHGDRAQEAALDDRRRGWRGDDKLLQEVKERLGPRPRAVLITCDKALALKARSLLRVVVPEYAEPREVKAYVDSAADAVALAAYLAGPSRIIVGNVSVNVKPRPAGDPFKPAVEVTCPSSVGCLAEKVRRTIRAFRECVGGA